MSETSEISTLMPQSAARQANSMPTPLKALRVRCAALLEIPTAALGIWVGGSDLLSAPWLISRVLGLILFLLGILVFAGVVPIAIYRRPIVTATRKRMSLAEAARRRTLSDSAERLIMSGAAAGIVIDIIFVLNAVRYENIRASLFALCGLPCLYVVRLYFNWALLEPYRKLAATAGVAGGLLSIIPFLYQTIYLPSTADVAIESTMTHAPPVLVGTGLEVVDVQVNVQVESSVPAVTLTSMLVVRGITYRGSGTDFSKSPSQKAAREAGLGQYSSPDLEFDGSSGSTLITLRRAVRDGAIVNPNAAFNIAVPVLIPVGRYQELDVGLMLLYARSDRLTLTSEYSGPAAYPFSRQCPGGDDIRSAWFIAQTKLSLLTRGRETAVTDWCSAVKNPSISSFIGGAPGAHTPSKVARLEELAYQTKYTNRSWVIELPKGN
jgi:hypothetical protein